MNSLFKWFIALIVLIIYYLNVLLLILILTFMQRWQIFVRSDFLNVKIWSSAALFLLSAF